MKTLVQGNTITFSFDDAALAPVVFDASLAEVHAQRAMLHGFEQKIRDSAAIARKQKDGSVIHVTEAMRHAEVLATVTRLTTTTQWNQAEQTAKQSPAIAALAAKLGKSYSEAEAWFAEKVQAELDAME